jgi:phage shock protein PspC (stress-responsive transcriptional regulator)
MTQNDGQTQHPVQEASGMDRFFGWLRALDFRRRTDDKWLAGVCSGIADRLGVDPLVIRAVLLVLILFGGIGITLYLIAWALVPNDKEEIVAERAVRQGDFWGIVLLVVLALAIVGGSGFVDGDGWGLWWFWWILIPVGVIVWLANRKKNPDAVRGAAERASAWGQQVGTTAGAWGEQVGNRADAWGRDAQATSTSTAQDDPGGAPVAPGSPVGGTAPLGPGMPGGPAMPGGPGAPYGPPQVRPAKPPRPPRPRRRSAGLLGAVIAGGLALAAYGLALWAHTEFDWAGNDHVVALATATGVLGLSVLAMGLAGFKSGLTGFLAVVLAVVTWSASVVPQLTIGGGIGDRTWRPAVAQGETYRLGIGSGNLYLGELDTSPGTPGELEASVGLGELRIYVPEDLTVEINSSVGGGTIREANGWSLDENGQWTERERSGDRIATTQVIGTGTPDLVLNANVGFGEIIVGKE